MNSLVAAAKPVIDVAEIGGVRLIRSNVGTDVRSPSEVPKPDVSLTYETEVLLGNDNSFFVVVGFDLQVAPEAHQAEESEFGSQGREDIGPSVWVEAAFEIAYRLPEDVEFDEETLDIFAAVNGVFNAWPYFREYSQSSMARMALPPIRLGLYKVPSPTEVEK